MFLHVISSFYTQKTNKHVLFNSVAKMFPHHIGKIDVCSSNFFLVCKILDDEDIYFNLKHPFCCSMQSVATILNWSSPTFQHCYFLSQNFFCQIINFITESFLIVLSISENFPMILSIAENFLVR